MDHLLRCVNIIDLDKEIVDNSAIFSFYTCVICQANFSIRFVTPVVLVILFVNDIIKEISQPYGDYPWKALIGIGNLWLGVALIAAFLVSIRPWRRDLAEPEHHQDK